MRLFEVGSDYRCLLNKEWLLLIPQFAKLIRRDKGSAGDYDGRRKLKTIKEFTFIYHISDPRSPLENFQEDERREKSLQYAELEEKDIDDDVMDALSEYELLLEYSSPSLPLLRAAKRTNSKLIIHFDTIDFGEKDNRGQLVHSASAHITNVSKLKVLHDNIAAFERIVIDELKEQKGTRGKTELGDKEQKGSTRKWLEGSAPIDKTPIPQASQDELDSLNRKAPSFIAISNLNKSITGKVEVEEEDGVS